MQVPVPLLPDSFQSLSFQPHASQLPQFGSHGQWYIEPRDGHGAELCSPASRYLTAARKSLMASRASQRLDLAPL